MTTTREWYGWLFAIRRTPRWNESIDWRDAFRAAGEDYLPGFDPYDGLMYMGRRSPYGRYQFVDPDEVASAFGELPWFDLASPCPFVGAVEGFLNWDWWTDDIEVRKQDIECFGWASNGYAVRLRDGFRWDVIAQNTYTLGEADQKHGFDGGGALLNLGLSYNDYVRGVIAQALVKHGLVVEPTWRRSSNNRMRIDQFIPQGRQTHGECWEVFERHRGDPLVFWAYNNQRAGLDEIVKD